MSVEVASAEKILAYDGDCPMCKRTVAMLIGLRLVTPEQTRSNHQLDQADFEAVYQAGMRNELVALDPESREVRTGSDGLLWIMRDTTGGAWWVRLLSLPGVRDVLRWGYQIISYNRRVISPPRHQIACDCEPEVTVARRVSLIVPVVLMVLLMAGLFGAAVFPAWESGSALAGATLLWTAVGSGSLALAIAGAVLLPADRRLDYVAHLAVTLFAGLFVLIPAALLALVLPREAAMVIAGLSVGGSLALMFAMQRRRVAALKIAQPWLWAWAATLVGGIALAAYFYFGVIAR